MAGFLLPLLLAGAGTGLSMYAQDKANKKRQALINQQAEERNQAKREQNSVLLDTLNDSNENREDRFNTDAGVVADNLASVQENPLLAMGDNSGSSDYTTLAAKAAADSGKSALKNARLKARASGINRLFAEEGKNLSKANTDMLMIGNFAQGQSNLLDNQINAVQPNPFLSFLGGAATSYGTKKADLGGLFS